MEDSRFSENRQCFQWLENWEKDALAQSHLKKKEQKRRFLADQTKFDVYSMILGFEEFCKHMFQDFPGCGIVTARTNQDTVENFFGGARSRNGQNNNPTIMQYGTCIVRHSQMEGRKE